MEYCTITELRAEAEKVCAWLVKHRGYDSASFRWATVHNHSVNFTLTTIDDFQKDAERSMRYHSGDFIEANIVTGESLWTWAANIPHREQREISFLLRQLKPIASAAEEVRSLEIQSIVQGILGATTSLQNLLEHDRSLEAQAEALADNPDIQF